MSGTTQYHTTPQGQVQAEDLMHKHACLFLGMGKTSHWNAIRSYKRHRSDMRVGLPARCFFVARASPCGKRSARGGKSLHPACRVGAMGHASPFRSPDVSLCVRRCRWARDCRGRGGQARHFGIIRRGEMRFAWIPIAYWIGAACRMFCM